MSDPAVQKQGKKFFPLFRSHSVSNFLSTIGRWARSRIGEPDYVREVLRDLPFSICSMDGPDLRITFANEPFRELVGTRERLVGRTVQAALGRTMPDCFFELVARVFRSGEPERAQEIRAVFSDRQGKPLVRYLDFECRPKLGFEGKIGGVIFLAIDVTTKVRERESAERRAENLRSQVCTRDEFLSIASHELKSPITSLKLQLQLTQKKIANSVKDAGEAEKLSSSLARSTDQVDRLTDMVDDLMDLTRISSGKLSFRFEHHCLSDLLRETIARLKSELTASGCELRTRIPPDLYGEFDRNRIGQVVVNLMTNAIKYAPGTPLEIEARADGNHLEFSFRDYGPGIPRVCQQRIFERFERVRPESRTPGLGLGLFIVNQIVQGHGGTISLESEESRGAKFTVRLPKHAH